MSRSTTGKWSVRVLVREHKMTLVSNAIANELANGGEETHVETKDGLIGLVGDRMLPMDHTDTVVIDNASHIDTNDLFAGRL